MAPPVRGEHVMGFDVADGVIAAARRNVSALFHDVFELWRVSSTGVDDLGGPVAVWQLVGIYTGHFAPLMDTADTSAGQTQPEKASMLDVGLDVDIRVSDEVRHGGSAYRVHGVKGAVHTALFQTAQVTEAAR